MDEGSIWEFGGLDRNIPVPATGVPCRAVRAEVPVHICNLRIGHDGEHVFVVPATWNPNVSGAWIAWAE
jgi:hypothetical protein